MQNPNSKTKNIRKIVSSLIGFSKDQLNEHHKFGEKLSDLLNLFDSSISSEESQTLTNSVINSPKGIRYTKDIIVCLTLRKISCRLKERFKKYTFFLIRSLYIETNRMNNLSKQQMKKRNKYEALGIGDKKLSLEIDLCSRDLMFLMKLFKRWEVFVKLFKVEKKAKFQSQVIEFLCRKVGKVQKIFFFGVIKGLYFDMIFKRNIKLSVPSLNSIISQYHFVSKLSTFHILKILTAKSRRIRLLNPLIRLSKLTSRLILYRNFK